MIHGAKIGRPRAALAGAVFALLAASGVSHGTSPPRRVVAAGESRGARAPIVGLWANAHERAPPPATACDYFRNLEVEHQRLRDRIVESGAGALTVPVTWRAVDLGGGRPDYSRVVLLLDAIDLGLDLFVNLAPVWSDRLETPEDLGEEPFDARPPAEGAPSPLDITIERGRVLIDELVRQVPAARERVRYLVLGNEVDLFVARDAAGAGRFFRPDGTATPAWLGYLRLVRALAPHARQRLPSAQVGVSVTLATALDLRGSRHVAALDASTDVTALTYHDGEPDRFGVALRALLARGPRHPVVFQEVAFHAPSGEEAARSRFVEGVFRAWRAAGERVPYLGFFSLHDWHHEPEPCEPPALPALCDPCDPGCRFCGTANAGGDVFVVRSAGLLRSDDTAKPAWSSFKELAAGHAGGSR